MRRWLFGICVCIVVPLLFLRWGTLCAADSSVNVGIFIVNPAKTQHEASGPGVISLDLIKQISQRMNWFVVIKGRTSPYARVYVLQNGARVGTVQANAAGEFEAGIHNPQSGAYEWSVYVLDQLGLESGKVTFIGEAREGTTVVFEPIIPPPTMYGVMGISGIVYHIGGTAIPGARVSVEIQNEQGNIQGGDYDIIAGPDGRWVQTLILSTLPHGTVIVHSNVEVEEGKSVSSLPLEIYFQKVARSKQDFTPAPSDSIDENEETQQVVQDSGRVPPFNQPLTPRLIKQGDDCEGDSCPLFQGNLIEISISRIIQDISFFVRYMMNTIVERVIWVVEMIR